MSTTIGPAPVTRNHSVTFDFQDIEFRKAENGRSENYTLRGHAAVFNSLSQDLGGFRETIEPGAFRNALRGTPDVRLLFNHDSNRVLARTTAQVDGKPSLELREDKSGLHVWAVIQPRSWVNDLALEMRGGLIDQMSFAFSLRDNGDEWLSNEDGSVTRTILPDGIDSLYDVSVVTFPAYPDSEVGIRELRYAIQQGRLPRSILGEPEEVTAANVSLADMVGSSPHDVSVVAEDVIVDSLKVMRAQTSAALQQAKTRHLSAMKGIHHEDHHTDR